MLQKIFYLALAGAAGTLFRYFLSTIVQKNVTTHFPLGTAAVNIIGCLLFGLLWALTQNKFQISPQLRIIIFAGFFGAFTTFSAYIFETSHLMDNAQWLHATGNCLLQNIFGMCAIVIGLTIGSLF